MVLETQRRPYKLFQLTPNRWYQSILWCRSGGGCCALALTVSAVERG